MWSIAKLLLAGRRRFRVCTLSFPVLPTSLPCHIVTVPTVLALLSPARSKCPPSHGVLPQRVVNAAYSGIAKSAKVIAVKVMDDKGCAHCLSLDASPSDPTISKEW